MNAQQNKRVSTGNVPIHVEDYVALEMIFAKSTTTYQNANQVRILIFIILHIPRLKYLIIFNCTIKTNFQYLLVEDDRDCESTGTCPLVPGKTKVSSLTFACYKNKHFDESIQRLINNQSFLNDQNQQRACNIMYKIQKRFDCW